MVEHASNALLKIVGPKERYPKVTLIDPAPSGYLLLAAEIDHRPPFGFFIESAGKRRVLNRMKSFADDMRGKPGVREATVFNAIIVPPGKGELLKERPNAKVARYDAVILVEFDTPADAETFAAGQNWQSLVEDVKKDAEKTTTVRASNGRRIGPVDHSRQGIFLFNYFFADDRAQNLAVWEYTAGWFEDQTGLDNSTLLLPAQSNDAVPYSVINHCRWDTMGDILPALLLKPDFRKFVLANFYANNTAAMPVLYRLA